MIRDSLGNLHNFKLNKSETPEIWSNENAFKFGFNCCFCNKNNNRAPKVPPPTWITFNLSDPIVQLFSIFLN